MAEKDTRSREARDELERLSRGGGVLDSHMSDAVRGRPTIDENDPAEVWGRRAGRGLAVIAGVLALAYIIDYVRQPAAPPPAAESAVTTVGPS